MANRADIQLWKIPRHKNDPGVAASTGHPMPDSACLSRSRQRGVTLIELVVSIVILSVASAGILMVMTQTVLSSADPMLGSRRPRSPTPIWRRS